MSMNKKNPELYGSGFYYQKIINNYKSIEFPKPLQTLGIDQQLLNCGWTEMLICLMKFYVNILENF